MSSKSEKRTVGVFQDEEQAQRVAEAVKRNGGEVRVGDADDAVDSLRAEMQDEMQNSFVSPQAALIVNKEQGKGLLVVCGALTVLGAIIGALVGLIPMAHLPLVTRVLIGALVCATAGATIGFVVGPGLASRGPRDAMAAEQGVTVSANSSPSVTKAMSDSDPIRIDLIDAESRATETAVTEEDEGGGGVFEDLADTWQHPNGQPDRR
jgi:hypothetical protein